MPPPLKVFISYAHKDGAFFAAFKSGLIKQLNNSNNFKFEVWDDSEITVGSDWNDEIQKNIEEAEIALFCVSDNFFNSEYIISSELSKIINKCPDTLSVPIFYDQLGADNWENLSRKQFFKPQGKEFGLNENKDLSFCELARLNNEKIDTYLSNLSKAIEKAYVAKNFRGIKLLPAGLQDKVIAIAILFVVIFSIVWLVYSVFKSSEAIANPPLSLVTFFGSSALFIFNRNIKPHSLAYA